MAGAARHAGLGSRILAYIVDIVIVIILNIILAGVLLVAMGTDGTSIVGLLGTIVNFGYFIYLEAENNGQTIGKSVVNIRVVSDTGQDIGMGTSAIRNILRIIDALPFLYLIGIILIAVSDESQRLGDMVGDTHVVET